jgi:hypothetical protein
MLLEYLVAHILATGVTNEGGKHPGSLENASTAKNHGEVP